jgi:hypothetical protein
MNDEIPFETINNLIEQVNFQLSNVTGYLSIKSINSAAIKSQYLTKAAKELEDFLCKLVQINNG